MTVDPYATATVMISILPALLPMSPIAVVTSPRMISGMMNPRNWLNMPLKVMNILTSHSGANVPVKMPETIAMHILPSSPIRIFFIVFH